MVVHKVSCNEHHQRKSRGFTLIELLVVLAVIALLLSISLPKYFQSIDMAKDRVLAENLQITRDVISKFYGDTGRYPDSLNELVERKYLRELPIDPVTEKAFIVIAPQEGYKGNIYDVKTSASGKSHLGKEYANF